MIIEGLTNNPARTAPDLRSILENLDESGASVDLLKLDIVRIGSLSHRARQGGAGLSLVHARGAGDGRAPLPGPPYPAPAVGPVRRAAGGRGVRLLRPRLVREDEDPDFSNAFEVSVDGDAAGFDLVVGHPAAVDGLEFVEALLAEIEAGPVDVLVAHVVERDALAVGGACLEDGPGAGRAAGWRQKRSAGALSRCAAPTGR